MLVRRLFCVSIVPGRDDFTRVQRVHRRSILSWKQRVDDVTRSREARKVLRRNIYMYARVKPMWLSCTLDVAEKLRTIVVVANRLACVEILHQWPVVR